MSVPMTFACVWVVAAWALSLFPSKRHHWPLAYVLIVLGLPILIWVFAADGLGPGLAVLVAGGLTLRWPIRYLGRWILNQVTGGVPPSER